MKKRPPRIVRLTRKLCRQLMKWDKFRDAGVARVGADESLLYDAMRHNTNLNDYALYNLLHCFRYVREAFAYVGDTWQGKSILELGTSKQPGLPLVMLLAGCEKYYANNIFPVNSHVSEPYARMIALLMHGLGLCETRRIEEVIQWQQNEDQVDAVLNANHFINLSPMRAEEINTPGNSADFIFSNTVLEHVDKPASVINRSFELLKPGGWCFHMIDLRDHNDFSAPLEFLKVNKEEYRAADRPCGENRLRANDFVEIFTNSGFELLGAQCVDQIPKLIAGGTTDFVDSLFQPWIEPEECFDFDRRSGWVSEELRSGLAAPFAQKSLGELSIVHFNVLCRKPQEATQR